MQQVFEKTKQVLKNKIWKLSDKTFPAAPAFYLSVLVALWAFILRYFQIEIGLPYLYFWDEPQIASKAIEILKTGDYNPRFFNYGSLLIYLNVFINQIHLWYLSLLSPESLLYVGQIGDVLINVDTGWHWTISHPSFYVWNRFLTALLGTGTIVVTYFLGKHIFNAWIGLIASFFLACLPIHITHSGYVTSDVPVAFFTTLVVLFALLFYQHKQMRYFVLSLVCVGVAIATKYNAGLSILVPLGIGGRMVWEQRLELKKTPLFMVVFIPMVVFLSVMPYALLNFPEFLNHVLDEMNHYKVAGHAKATSVPGWDHFVFQLNNFYEHLGFIGVVLVLFGIGAVFLKPTLIMVLFFPVVYLLFMINMKVNFHRNFILIYPFIAILIGAGFYQINDILNKICRKYSFYKSHTSVVFTVLLALCILVPQAYASYLGGVQRNQAQDTRSVAIDVINELQDITWVVFAKELRMHPLDLARLKYGYTEQTIEMMCAQPQDDGVVFVVPSDVSQVYSYYSQEIRNKQSLLDRISTDQVVKRIENRLIGTRFETMLDVYSTNPSLIIVQQMPYQALQSSLISLDNCTQSETGTRLQLDNELTLNGGYIVTPKYNLERGQYSFSFFLKKPALRAKTKVFGWGEYEMTVTITHVWPFDGNVKVKVSVLGEDGLLKEQIYDPTEEFLQEAVVFDVLEKQGVFVKIENVEQIKEGDKPSETIVGNLKIVPSNFELQMDVGL